MKIIACLPCYKIMDIPAVVSLLQLQAHVFGKGDEIKILVSHGYLVDRARQNMVEVALKEDADYILNIDSDHVFDADDIYKLIDKLESNNLKMLSAKYYVRNALMPPRPLAMCKWNEDGKKYDKVVPEENESGIQDCDVVGNGFLVMKHDFVKQLYDKYKTLFKLSMYGEDAYFCEIVRKENERVCYDADVLIGHLSLVNNK